MANKLIQQPDILNLDSLGAFMDAQNDPIGAPKEEKELQEVVKAEETVTETENQDSVLQEDGDVVPEVEEKDANTSKAKPVRTRKKKTKTLPVIEAGSNEWDMMVRYAEFYNFNPDEDRITVVLNPEIKHALDVIRINCRQFNFGNILNAVCRTFIERNKDHILSMQKNKGGIL